MATYDTIEDTETALAASGNNISNWTVDDIRKSDILVFRESATEYIDTVVAPNGFQVGLLDEAFLTDLLVTGHITGSGIIYSEMGFSGSLQTLVDGTDYLRGAGGITITNNEDGSITIGDGGSSSESSRIKEEITPTSKVSAGMPLLAPGCALANYGYDDNLIDVFLNGDLLKSGTQTQVEIDGTADYWIDTDLNGDGQLVFRYDITNLDELFLIAGSGGSGNGGGSSSEYAAGSGMSLNGSAFKVNVDGYTTRVNSSNQVEVQRTIGSMVSGAGVNPFSFDGSGNASVSVKAVSGSPIAVTGAGVGFDMSPLSGVTLAGADEVLVSQGGVIAKTTVSDILALGTSQTGAPTTAAYLVASHSSDLSNERILAAGNGISINDTGANGSMTVSALVQASGGLKFVSGKLAVKVGDFVGFGLTENGGVIDINASALAGPGLTTIGNQLAIDFAQTAAATNTIGIAAGDGLSQGGTATIGAASSLINLEVNSEDIKGLGLSVEDNNLNVFLQGVNGINILTGSNGELLLDGSNVAGTDGVSDIVGGPGINTTFDVDLKEYSVSIDYQGSQNIITNAQNGTAVVIDGENDRFMMYDADAQKVVFIKADQVAGSKVTEASSGIVAVDDGSTVLLEVDYDDIDNVVTSAHDPIENWEIDEQGDKILLYDADEEKVIKISPASFTGGAGKIGEAEDGAYTDGLFTDFNPDTPTGTAIDRFNEILKALAPTPAPSLYQISENVSNGQTALLSFGSSNSTSYENVAALNSLPSVDANEQYSYDASSDDIALGIYTSFPTIRGSLNEDVTINRTSPSNLTNYSANAFDSGNIGDLILEVNGVIVQTLDLTDITIGSGNPGVGNSDYLVDGSGFENVSIAKSGLFDSGASFETFKHRTADYTVGQNHQRLGWNYLQVKHVKSPTNTIITNHVQWIVDNNAEQVSASVSSATFSGTGSFFLSGVEYYTAGSINYQSIIENYYKFVYTQNTINFNESVSGLHQGFSYSVSNIPTPLLDLSGGDTHEKVIVINVDTPVASTWLLDADVATSMSVSHITKSNMNSQGNTIINSILMYSVASSSSDLQENFVDENYRLPEGLYVTQSEVATAQWDSSAHMSTTELQLFRERLYSPLNTVEGGDFSGLANGPAGNPDYSNSSGTLTYFRKFQNTDASVQDFQWSLQGSSALVPSNSSMGSNQVKVSFKLPSNGTDDSGWMDANSPFSYNETSDGDGGYIGDFDSSVNSTNFFSFGTGSINTNDYIVAKIEADDSWNGYLDSFDVTFGATGPVLGSSDLETLSVNQSEDSSTARLSWGDTLSLSGYATVETDGGNNALNANDLIQSTANRVGIIGPNMKQITGTLNFGKTGSGNSYPPNAFGGQFGNRGTLKLFLNGNLLHSVDLETFGAGDSLNGANGFTLSAAQVGEDSNNLPNYNFWYRTGTYQIGTGNQRNGWNWARIDHEIDGVINDTNYVEWINDTSNPILASSAETLYGITDTDFSYLSGIKYFESPSGEYSFTMSNVYKYVYSSGPNVVTIPTKQNCLITSITVNNGQNTVSGGVSSALPPLDVNLLSAYDTDVDVTVSWNYSGGNSIPGATTKSVTLRGSIDHPLVSSGNSSQLSTAPFLVATINDSSTDISENFSGEEYRLQELAFSTQGDVTSNVWDSQESLIGTSSGHNNGLAVYNGSLSYPSNIGLSTDLGDFRDISESGPIAAPLGNPDYSVASGDRVYYRKIRNNTGSSQSNLDISISGSGSIATGASPSGNSIKVYIKLPKTVVNFETGFLDISKPFATNQYADGDGALLGTLDSTLNATNSVTLGVNSVQDDEWVIIKIVAAATWSGYVSSMSVSWG